MPTLEHSKTSDYLLVCLFSAALSVMIMASIRSCETPQSPPVAPSAIKPTTPAPPTTTVDGPGPCKRVTVTRYDGSVRYEQLVVGSGCDKKQPWMHVTDNYWLYFTATTSDGHNYIHRMSVDTYKEWMRKAGATEVTGEGK